MLGSASFLNEKDAILLGNKYTFLSVMRLQRATRMDGNRTSSANAMYHILGRID